jgi:hypothetical protein
VTGYEALSDTELVGRYAAAAKTHGAATAGADSVGANNAADVLAIIYRELRRRGAASQAMLVVLLDNLDPHVRMWAAAHALEFAPSQAEATLARLARGESGVARFDAAMTLREWKAGRLKFP